MQDILVIYTYRKLCRQWLCQRLPFNTTSVLDTISSVYT